MLLSARICPRPGVVKHAKNPQLTHIFELGVLVEPPVGIEPHDLFHYEARCNLALTCMFMARVRCVFGDSFLRDYFHLETPGQWPFISNADSPP